MLGCGVLCTDYSRCIDSTGLDIEMTSGPLHMRQKSAAKPGAKDTNLVLSANPLFRSGVMNASQSAESDVMKAMTEHTNWIAMSPQSHYVKMPIRPARASTKQHVCVSMPQNITSKRVWVISHGPDNF